MNHHRCSHRLAPDLLQPLDVPGRMLAAGRDYRPRIMHKAEGRVFGTLTLS